MPRPRRGAGFQAHLLFYPGPSAFIRGDLFPGKPASAAPARSIWLENNPPGPTNPPTPGLKQSDIDPFQEYGFTTDEHGSKRMKAGCPDPGEGQTFGYLFFYPCPSVFIRGDFFAREAYFSRPRVVSIWVETCMMWLFRVSISLVRFRTDSTDLVM